MSTSRRNCTTRLPPSNTPTISFTGVTKPHQKQSHTHHTNGHHQHSNTQPQMAIRDVLANTNFSNPQSSPSSPSALQRYGRSDTHQTIYTTHNKDKPLPSRPGNNRPLTPITYNYDFFTANTQTNNQNRHTFKNRPTHTKHNTVPQNMQVQYTRRRHQGTVSGSENWQLRFEKLKERFEKLEREHNQLKLKNGALTRKYNDKCMECKDLSEEKAELKRNLKQVRRRDSIAKSDKSDNISLSEFSDNKSEYSAMNLSMNGIGTNLKHTNSLIGIASPSQSALSSIPPYNPNMHKRSNKGFKKPKLVFSDDGTDSVSSSLASSNPKKYKRLGYNVSRMMGGSISSLESENRSQKFSVAKTVNNSYKSSDNYENMDPYAIFAEII